MPTERATRMNQFFIVSVHHVSFLTAYKLLSYLHPSLIFSMFTVPLARVSDFIEKLASAL